MFAGVSDSGWEEMFFLFFFWLNVENIVVTVLSSIVRLRFVFPDSPLSLITYVKEEILGLSALRNALYC